MPDPASRLRLIWWARPGLLVLLVAGAMWSGFRTARAQAPSAVAATPPRHAALRLLDLFTAAGGPVVPGAVPAGLSGISPAECASCHAEIAAEWQFSAHARAFSNAVFQGEYQPAKERFCQKCHAPLVTDPAASDAPELFARGVDCAVCHVRQGQVLGAHGRGDSDHAARKDARLATSAFCGSCHQFDFPAPAPDQPVRYHPGQPLQDTLVEHARSPYARVTCQGCHMPAVPAPEPGAPGARPHRSHAFATFEDRALMAGAVKVRVRARRQGRAVIASAVLAAGKLGHGFPTGDMFRKGILTLRLGAQTQVVVLQRIFAPTITADARGHLLGQVDDTRLLPGSGGGAQRHTFRFEPAGEAEALEWTLELYRLDPATARERGLPQSLIRVPMLAGTAPVRRSAPVVLTTAPPP